MALTLARVIAIPAFIALWHSSKRWAPLTATAVFVAAAVTDFLDGYLARLLDASSDFGAFLDPVADKLMVATALILLTASANRPLCTLCTAIIIGREITMSALREWASSAGPAARSAVAVGLAGKLKTTMQLIALSVLCLARVADTPPALTKIGLGLLATAAFLTLWSVGEYFVLVAPFLAGKRCPQTGRRLP